MDIRAVLKALKFCNMVQPELKDNGAFTNKTYFDTQGLSGLLVLFIMGQLDIGFGSNTAAGLPALEECDTTGGTYTAISGAALTACPVTADDGKMYGIFVDLSKTRKRYIQVDDPVAGDGTAGVAAAVLGIGFPSDVMPRSAAEMGLAELISA
jgi:hypothetical protein